MRWVQRNHWLWELKNEQGDVLTELSANQELTEFYVLTGFLKFETFRLYWDARAYAEKHFS